MKFQKNEFVMVSMVVLGLGLISLTGCGKLTSGSDGEDSSASGAAAGAVGGALSSSSSNGTQASYLIPKNQSFFAKASRAFTLVPNAYAFTSCPTFHTIGAGCSVNSNTMYLSYNDCSFAGAASWQGVQALEMSSGTPSCGTFPLPGGTGNGTLTRQFVQAAGANVPGSVTLTSSMGSGVIDDATANLGNFDGDSIAAIANGGYGTQVTFSGGARTSVKIAHRTAVTGFFDHSVTGTLSVSEAAGASARTVSGQVEVYHNILRVIGTSVFNNVVHQDGCCLPVSGSITTTFSAGANVSPTALGQKAVGKSETLTFTGCGTATLQAYDGSTKDVSLDRCF